MFRHLMQNFIHFFSTKFVKNADDSPLSIKLLKNFCFCFLPPPFKWVVGGGLIFITFLLTIHSKVYWSRKWSTEIPKKVIEHQPTIHRLQTSSLRLLGSLFYHLLHFFSTSGEICTIFSYSIQKKSLSDLIREVCEICFAFPFLMLYE